MIGMEGGVYHTCKQLDKSSNLIGKRRERMKSDTKPEFLLWPTERMMILTHMRIPGVKSNLGRKRMSLDLDRFKFVKHDRLTYKCPNGAYGKETVNDTPITQVASSFLL